MEAQESSGQLKSRWRRRPPSGDYACPTLVLPRSWRVNLAGSPGAAFPLSLPNSSAQYTRGGRHSLLANCSGLRDLFPASPLHPVLCSEVWNAGDTVTSAIYWMQRDWSTGVQTLSSQTPGSASFPPTYSTQSKCAPVSLGFSAVRWGWNTSHPADSSVHGA